MEEEKKEFRQSRYTATKWDTAERKTAWAIDLYRFISRGCRLEHFDRDLYERLSKMFGFIAHYDRNTFWDVRFGTTRALVETFQQIADCPCHGDPAFTWSDVERDLKAWVVESGYLDRLKVRVSREVERRERAELARLKAKYEGK